MRDQKGADRLIVLGAGIAGLAAADRLARAGHRVTVIEARPDSGGTHRAHAIGPYTFDVGSIFYEEAARLFDLAPGLREMAPMVRRIQRRVGPQGKLMQYPIEPRDLLRWPRRQLARAVWDMLRSRLLLKRDGTLETVCLQRLGPTIFEGTGLKSYITRFHHVSPKVLDEEFFYSRMGFIEKATRPKALLRAGMRALLRKPFRRGPPAVLRVRPVEGFAPMFDAVQARLETHGVQFVFDTALERIERRGAGFAVVTPGETFEADGVISTVPLETVHRAVFGTPLGLRSLDLMTLFVSAGRLEAEAGNVLFNFHAEGRWKRITVYSRIYPERMRDREFFSVEITLPPDQPPDPEAAFADLSGHLDRLGIAGDLALEGHTLVPAAYPLYVPGHGAVLAARLAALRDFGIVTVGRQGRFEYLPTSSGVIRRVDEELDGAGLLSPVKI